MFLKKICLRTCKHMTELDIKYYNIKCKMDSCNMKWLQHGEVQHEKMQYKRSETR